MPFYLRYRRRACNRDAWTDERRVDHLGRLAELLLRGS